MTPAEWAELDADERSHAEAVIAVLDQPRPPTQGDSLDQEMFDRWSALESLLTRHARELIDAARPKCPTCNGNKIRDVEYHGASTGLDVQAVYLIHGPCPCTGTNHPGWAA